MRSRFESNLLSAQSTLPSRPISPQMLSVVKAHTTFLVAVRSSLTDTSTWDATRASHVVKLITSIRTLATIDLQDAANTLEHIRVCGCFSADQQKDIVATINSSASGPVCAPAGDRSTLTPQEHFYLHRYMSHADWSTLRSPASSMSTKITTLVNRCVQIGLLSLTEKTSQSIVCTLAATCDHHVDHSEMYNNMVGLKAAFRKMRLSRCAGTCKPSLAKFPEDVSQFISQFPGFYDVDDQPVKCPIDEAAIMSLRSQVACRKTHNSLRNTHLAVPSSSSSSSAMSMHAMLPLILQAIQGKRQHADVELTFPKKCARPMSTLALLDGSPIIEDPFDSPSPKQSTSPGDTTSPVQAAAAQAVAVVDAPSNSGITAAAAAVQAALAGKGTARAKGTAKGKAKGKAKGQAKSKAKAKANVKAKASPAKSHGKPVDGQLYGCGKCRGNHKGCGLCRSPTFTGKMWQK